MVTSRLHWLAPALAAAVFALVLAVPYHSSELALLARRSPLYALDAAAPLSRLLHLCLHLAAVWLAAGILPTLLPRGATVALLLFAIHPLHTQALASLEARPLLLAAVLSLAALHQWLRLRDWPAVSLGILAILADWSAAALPALLWLWSSRDQRRAAAAPLGVLSGVALASLIHLLGATAAPSAAYLSLQGAAIVRLLGLFLLPYGLTPSPALHLPPLALAAAWGGLLALALPLILDRRGPWRLLASIFLLLAPTSSFLALPQTASDLRLLPALLFVSAAAASLLASADRRLLATACALFALVSLLQTDLWRSERAVWLEATRLAPAEIEPRRRLARLLDPPHAFELLAPLRLANSPVPSP